VFLGGLLGRFWGSLGSLWGGVLKKNVKFVFILLKKLKICTVKDLLQDSLVVSTKGVKEQIVQNQAVDSQKPGSRKVMQRTWLVATMLLIAVSIAFWRVHALGAQDPYVQSVLQKVGDPNRGQEIFQMNCATCHGLAAAGEVGPDLREVSQRKSSVALIQQVISGKTPPMPQFQPNERDMADLLSFLKTL
jgi:mono/diheme cytochrome c family protein